MKHSPPLKNALLNKAFLLLLLIFSSMSYSQTQLLNWVLPPEQVDFTGTSPTHTLLPTMDYSGINANTMGSMHDIAGNLSFYIVDGVIYDKDGYQIDELRVNGALTSGGEEISIIPVPGSCTRYYIVTGALEVTGTISTRGYPIYALIDMSVQNLTYPSDPTKKGALTYFTGSFPSGNNAFDLSTIAPPAAFPTYALHNNYYFGIATTPYRTATNDYFLFVKGKTEIWRYLVNASGISYSSTNNPFSIPSTVAGQNNTSSTELEVIVNAAGNYQLAYVYSDIDIVYPEVDFNTGALISNNFLQVPNTVGSFPQIPAVVGLEFSPNGQYLYFSHKIASVSTYTNPLHYFDVTVGSPTTIALPTSSYPGSVNAERVFIELGHDGKLYFNNGLYVSSLANPNSGASPANWTNIAINVTTVNKLLPDQMDGNNYANTSSTSMACCVNNAQFIVDSYTANTTNGFSTSVNQTWTPTSNPFIAIYNAAHPGAPVSSLSTITVGNELVIPPTFRITITGMRFEFKPRTTEYVPGTGTIIHYGARTIVQNNTSSGGQLTLNSTTLTSYDACGLGMWEGVEAWGNSAIIQNTTQGRVNVNASSFISNAYCGIFTGKKGIAYALNSVVAGTTGALVVTNGATFRNNYIDVLFNPYTTTNSSSSFRYTTFITDAALNPGIAIPLMPYAHVQLNTVTNINFKTCTFKNAVPTIYPVASTSGRGIYAFESQFFCNSAIVGGGAGCTFENLKNGIYATATTIKTVTVDQCIFKNTYRCTYLGSITTATLTRNKYFIYEYPTGTSEANAAYGVYLDYCTGFKVTENSFYYNSFNETTGAPVTGVFNVYGCIVNQSHPNRAICHDPSGYNGDVIYKNLFQEIYVATQAQGANSERNVGSTIPGDPNNNNPCYGGFSTPNNIGLYYSCNNYVGVDKYNIRVTNYSAGSVSGNIAYQQGTSSDPAGNRFSHDPFYTTATQNEIFMDASYSTSNPNNIQYVYHGASVVIDRTQPNFYTPYTGFMNPTGVSPVSVPMSLADNGCPSRRSTEGMIEGKQKMKEAQDAIDTKQSILEGGNTQELFDLVATGTNNAILDNLLAKSPYLSDNVLMAAINKGLPANDLQQIILANSPVSETIKEALDAVSLPVGVRSQINAVQTGISARKAVEDAITDNTNNKGYYYNDIIRYFLNDTINPNGLDSVIKTVKDFDAPDNLCTVTKALIAKGDIINAQQTVNDAGAGGLCDYLNTLITIAQQPDGAYSLQRDESIKQDVEDIAGDANEKISAGAEGMLQFVLDNPFQEWLEPFEGSKRMAVVTQEESTKVNDVSEISIYPNPAQNILNINYQLPNDATQATLNTYDYTGKLIDSKIVYGNTGFATFSVENLPNGIYLYKVMVGNTTISSQRIAITK